MGQICLQNELSSPPNVSRLSMGGVSLIIQFSYTMFFFWRIQRYVRRYGRKLCAIGKYRRNCNSLKTTTFCAFLSCFFPNFNYWFREIVRFNTTAQFVIQFFLKDFLMELFFTGLFFISASDDIPSEEETPRRTIFYVSRRPKHLEPRRPKHLELRRPTTQPTFLPPPDLESAAEVRSYKNMLDNDDNIKIPLARVTRNGYKVTIYHATFKIKAEKEDLQRVKVNILDRQENVAVIKGTHPRQLKMVSPDSEDEPDAGQDHSGSERFSYLPANYTRGLRMRSQNTKPPPESYIMRSQNTKSSPKPLSSVFLQDIRI